MDFKELAYNNFDFESSKLKMEAREGNFKVNI